MLVTKDGMVTVVKLLQLEKAYVLIDVTDEGMSMDVKWLQS